MQHTVEKSSISRQISRVGRTIWIALLFLTVCGVLSYAIPAVRSAYIYYHRRGEAVVWQGMEFRLPAPWFRVSYTDAPAVFLRDQLPGSSGHGIPQESGRSFAIISLLPADSDFAQVPDTALTRWEQASRALASWKNPLFIVTEDTFTNTRNANGEFRCANLVMRGRDNKVYVDVECISIRGGWRFDYEGLREYAPEAISVLAQSR